MTRSVQQRPSLFGRAPVAVHALGVHGMGLGPLAIYLAGMGFRVTGADDHPNPAMGEQLKRAGVVMTDGRIIPEGVELIVVSSALPATHPALLAARERSLPVVRRGQLLAELARTRKLIAVCGSHGKTTTTAMILTAMRRAGVDVGYVGGGLFADEAVPPAAAGEVEWLVAEIDESDGTISCFNPELTVLVNLDWDHPDHYRTQADLEAAFAELLKRTSGQVLINAACPISKSASAQVTNVKTFGRGGDYELVDTRKLTDASTELQLGGLFTVPTVQIRAYGEFNALNATAALAAADLAGAALHHDLLASYPGVRRRQAVLAEGGGFVVLEDYAHHPAEISALLGGLRARMSAGRRLHVVFQPHRYSRTAQFRNAFARSLSVADAVYLMDVYGAGEEPITGGETADLHHEFRREYADVPLVYLSGPHDMVFKAVEDAMRPGDMVAIVGAGDLDFSARAWLAARDSSKWWDRVAEFFRGFVSGETQLIREAPLASKTTMGVGGAARLYCEPASEDDLVNVIRAAKEIGLRVLPLGRGSNLIVPDEGVDALVLSLRHPSWESFVPLGEGRVRVGAGLRLKNLCGLASKAGLSGFEFLEGIPGNVGGALRMNAGAMGGWMFDVVESVEMVTMEAERRTLGKASMHVDYRHCAELETAVATAAVIVAKEAVAAADVSARIDQYRDKRKKSQPREPSAGCIFKNPPADSAGRLIDASGLKGLHEGDAEVSKVHANFIVNNAHASATDVIALVRRVRAEVEKNQGIRLEPEVMLYGKNWKDVL